MNGVNDMSRSLRVEPGRSQEALWDFPSMPQLELVKDNFQIPIASKKVSQSSGH